MNYLILQAKVIAERNATLQALIETYGHLIPMNGRIQPMGHTEFTPPTIKWEPGARHMVAQVVGVEDWFAVVNEWDDTYLDYTREFKGVRLIITRAALNTGKPEKQRPVALDYTAFGMGVAA